MKVSIIVSTYNRCEKLKLLLGALKNLYLTDTIKCEILVVDNNSNDFTKQVLANYLSSERPVFKYIFEENQGKSIALNTGIREAEGDILVFTDDDCIPDPHWIEYIVKEFTEDSSLAVLGGRVELYNKDDSPHSISFFKNREYILRPRDVCLQPRIMGNNMAIRRNTFNNISEFDPLLGPGSICRAAEDIEFLYRLYKRGCKMVYSPDALVFHNHGRKTRAEDDAVSREYGIGRGGLYFKHIRRFDFYILRIACQELYSLSRTLLKGFIVRKTFKYHKITFTALFDGAFYYYKANLSKNKDFPPKSSLGSHS
jgi:GT2 family glycosyltransferase